MENVQIKKYQTDTELSNYFPLPRSMLRTGLSSTALLTYAVLLDRATLSQKNGFNDENGWVFVIYPVEHLADTLGVCPSVVKKHLKTLEDAGLIRRCRPSGYGASQIYLCLPEESIKKPTTDEKIAPDGSKNRPPTGKKVPPNSKTKQPKLSDAYYQHAEEESL